MRRIWPVLGLVPLALVVVVQVATGQPPRRPKPPEPPPIAPSTIANLKSTEPMQVRAALDEVRMAGKGGASAAGAVDELLTRGATMQLTQAAIETLADLEQESSSATVGMYARHRNVLIRDAAVRALARTRGPDAVKALRLALSDMDATVRQDAVAGLHALIAKDAVADLYLALEHRVPGAAAAIGDLCGSHDCERFMTLVDRLPFSTIATGLQKAMLRPSYEVGDDAKVRILEKLGAMKGQEVHGFLGYSLEGLAAQWKTQAKKVREALEKAVQTTGGQ